MPSCTRTIEDLDRPRNGSSPATAVGRTIPARVRIAVCAGQAAGALLGINVRTWKVPNAAPTEPTRSYTVMN
jgi:hypothetical protein